MRWRRWHCSHGFPPGTALAEEPVRTFSACGGTVVSQFLVRDNIQTKERPSGVQFTGSLVLRLADEDSSIVVRIPGRLLAEEVDGRLTVRQSGRTLYSPAFPSDTAAFLDFFGTDLVLVRGSTVVTERVNPDGSPVEGSLRVVSATGRVTDLCELLAQ